MTPRPSRLLLPLFIGLSCSDYGLTGPKGEEQGGSGAEDTDDPVIDTADPDESGPTGGVTGIICATDGDGPVVGATVWVEVDGSRITTETDGDGVFLLEGLPEGIHTITAEKGSFQTTFEVLIEGPAIVELAEEECLSGDIDIAVFEGDFDSVEDVLVGMGLEPDVYPGVDTPGGAALLLDPAALAEYEIVLINCDIALGWTGDPATLTANLRSYVEQGGSLYVSDWAAFVVESTFPDAIDFLGDDASGWDHLMGEGGPLTADVRDPVLQTALGSAQADIMFDLPGWSVAEGVGDAEVLVDASISVMDFSGTMQNLTAPLLVRFERGDGVVTFTAFHNEPQATSDMRVILEQLVESL